MSLSPEEVQYELAHIDEDKSHVVIVTTSVFTAFAIIAVILRFVARHIARMPFWYDDFLVIMALISNQMSTVTGLLGPKYGLGKHEIATPTPDLISLAKLLFAYDFGYNTAILLIKLSILQTYRRIFPVVEFSTSLRQLRGYSLAWWVITFLVTVWWIVFMFATLFQCTPISLIWNSFQKGTCLSIVSLYFSCFSNISLDFCILALPVQRVWQLHLRVRQKVALTAVFLIGGFVCVASIVRVVVLIQGGGFRSDDFTWRNADSLVWSTLETYIGIICACLPVMRPLLWNRKRSDRARRRLSHRPEFSFSASVPVNAPTAQRLGNRDNVDRNAAEEFTLREHATIMGTERRAGGARQKSSFESLENCAQIAPLDRIYVQKGITFLDNPSLSLHDTEGDTEKMHGGFSSSGW